MERGAFVRAQDRRYRLVAKLKWALSAGFTRRTRVVLSVSNCLHAFVYFRAGEPAG
jgi:hypothetical protein